VAAARQELALVAQVVVVVVVVVPL
jgi:hypothetical protein